MNGRTLFLSLTLSVGGVLLSACSESPAGPLAGVTSLAPSSSKSASPIPDISGNWTFHEDGTYLQYNVDGGAAKAYRCSSDGMYTFAQTGNAFAGSFNQSGSCTAADGTTFPLEFTDASVTDGKIQGGRLSFVADGAPRYEGAVRGPTQSTMGGAGQVSGSGFSYRASWSATR
jgi:hypothetical protein